VLRYPPEQRFALLVLRVPDEATAAQIAEILDRFLASSDLVEELPGHPVILERDRVRFRPPVKS
jgi:hypothetical protein